MPKSFYTKLKGVSKKNEDGRSRQEVIEEDLYEGLELHLEREPDNPNDSDAIAVFSSEYGDKVGYISGDLADQLAPQIDRGQLITCQVTEITGDFGQTRGVNVLITVYTLAESKLKDELGKADQPVSEPAPATEEQKFIPEPPKPAEEVPQPSSRVNEWETNKAHTPPPDAGGASIQLISEDEFYDLIGELTPTNQVNNPIQQAGQDRQIKISITNPQPPKPAEEVPQPSSQVNEWRATKAYTPPPVLRAIEPKRKLTLKQRWLALPKKARTWIIITLVILLIYFFGR